MFIQKILKHSLVKDTLLYGLADAVQNGVSFITLPVFSRYILPEELGIVANYDVLVQILSLIAGMAVINALPYFYYERTKEQMAQLVSTILLLVLSVNICGAVIIILTTGIIENYLMIGLGLQLLSVFNVLNILLNQVDNVLFRLEEKPKVFVTLIFLGTFLNVSFLLYFIVFCEMGGIGKIYGHFLNSLLLCVVHIYFLMKRKYFTFGIQKADAKMIVRYGLPLLPHSLSFWIKSGMDKILLTTFCGLAINGLYSMAMNLGAIYSIFRVSFGNAYIPYLQKRLAAMTNETEKEEKRRIVRLSYGLMLGYMVLGVVATGASWCIITFLLSDKYLLSFQFVPWIMASLTIYSIYGLTIEFAYTSKKTAGIGAITFSGSLVQCLCTYQFLQWWGEDGIKYSLIVGSLFIMIGIWWYSNKVYPMPWASFWRNDRRI